MQKRRQIFVDEHKCWVDFLNLSERSMLEPDIHFRKINTYKDTAFFQNFRRMSSLPSYSTEYDFLLNAQYYMKENLKRITRENAQTLQDTAEFSLTEEVHALMSLIEHEIVVYPTLPFIGNSVRIKRLENITPDTFIPILAEFMYHWLQYIHEYVCGEIKEDIFKIGVCQYAKKGEKECGKVFWGKTKKSEACEAHRLKWAKMKSNRKRYASD